MEAGGNGTAEEGDGGMSMAICARCSHSYDTRDSRGRFYARKPDLNRCPACHLLEEDESFGTMWVIKNDCNGPFYETMRPFKADCEAILAKDDHAGGYIVPVQVVQVPKEDWWWREHINAERTKWR